MERLILKEAWMKCVSGVQPAHRRRFLANMNTELCVEPNLVVYYKFNQGITAGNNPNENVANDYSGSFNMGTMYNFALSGNTSNWVNGVNLVVPGPTLQVSNQTNVNCFGDSTGSATINASGGVPPYQYLWPTGAQSATANNLGAGTYNVTVLDVLFCASEVQVSLTENPELVSTHTTNPVTCFGDTTGQGHISASGGVGTLVYNWSNGGAQSSQTGLAAGTYTVQVSDSLGCLLIDTLEIEHLFDSLAITIDTVIDAVCEGGSDGEIIASVAGGQIPYSFLWNDPASQIFAHVSGLAEGIYGVTVTDGSGCSVEEQATVGFQFSAPGINLGPDIVSSSSSAQVSAPTGFATYEWSTGAATSVIVVTQSGTYTVTVTDDNGCTNSDEIQVTVAATGLDEFDQTLGQVTLFPNPVRDVLTVQYEALQGTETLQWELHTVLGQRLDAGRINTAGSAGQRSLDVSTLPSGIYILHLFDAHSGNGRSLMLEKQ